MLAAALGVVVPSGALASRSDLLLAALVLATALGISFDELRRLRDHTAAVAVLSIAPLVFLGAAGWALGRPFAPPIRDGLLAAGLASAEVASVGLVALAGADATIALGALTGSLIAAAVIGPMAIGALAGASPTRIPYPCSGGSRSWSSPPSSSACPRGAAGRGSPQPTPSAKEWRR